MQHRQYVGVGNDRRIDPDIAFRLIRYNRVIEGSGGGASLRDQKSDEKPVVNSHPVRAV